jgi:hypothetical protein
VKAENVKQPVYHGIFIGTSAENEGELESNLLILSLEMVAPFPMMNSKLIMKASLAIARKQQLRLLLARQH